MVKVSILVPIYNVEKYLRECLDSLVTQTLQDIEIICINDGSTDNSLNIISEYAQKDNRIKVIDKPNSGYGASMNRGLEVATGDYIGILEPDDYTVQNMYEDLYELAIKNDADLVKSDWFEFYTEPKLIRKAGRFALLESNKILNVKTTPELLKIQPAIWSGIYKRSLIYDNNVRFLETPGASFQDTSFAFKTMCLAKNVVLTNQAYIHYRQDNNASSVKSSAKVYAICTEYEEINKFMDLHKDLKPYINAQKMGKEYDNYVWNLKRIDESFRLEFIEKMSEIFNSYNNNNEIGQDFFEKVNKKDFNLLLNNQKEYKKLIDRKIRKEKFKKIRRQIFSLHINKSRIDLVICGKQILGGI